MLIQRLLHVLKYALTDILHKIQQINVLKFVLQGMLIITVDIVLLNVLTILSHMVMLINLVIKSVFINVYQEDFLTMLPTYVIQNVQLLLIFMVILIWEDVCTFVLKDHMHKTQQDNVLSNVLKTVMLII